MVVKNHKMKPDQNRMKTPEQDRKRALDSPAVKGESPAVTSPLILARRWYLTALLVFLLLALGVVLYLLKYKRMEFFYVLF